MKDCPKRTPTEFTTTIVLLLTAETAAISCTSMLSCCEAAVKQPTQCTWFPLCQGFRSFLSPALPSTVIYPSPESAEMKTMATLLPRAAFAAPLVSVSLVLDVILALVWALIAESGSLRYGKFAVPEPQPTARIPVSQPLSVHAV